MANPDPKDVQIQQLYQELASMKQDREELNNRFTGIINKLHESNLVN